MEYKINIAGYDRYLPICPVNDTLYIGAFVMFGDAELTVACASELLKKAPEYDYIITAEAKGIPLAYEMAKQHGDDFYCVVRKKKKLYMRDVIGFADKSITTVGDQMLYLDGNDAAKMKGKRILIVDDVISTGGSLASIEHLVNEIGGNIVGKMFVLAEGDAKNRSDIIYLEPLPLFDAQGNILG